MSNKNPKGFDGVSQLHSKSEAQADPVESNFQSETPTDTITTPLYKAQSGSQRDNTVDVGSESEVTDGTLQDDQQEGNKSGGSWGYIFGFLLIVGIFLVIVQDNDSPSSVPKSATSSSLANSTAKTPTASQLGSPSVVGKTNKPRNETPELQYNKPPVGSNNILSVSQIRWCTREIMRIDAMRNIFDTNGGIGEFNRIVNDYNSRCSDYRYRQGNLSRAEREVEKSRAIIVSEATREAELIDQRFKKTSNVSTKSASNKPNAQLTREVQQLLTVLGYKPGPIDGDYGPGTASAIKVFQRDSGLTQTGRVDRELLSSLRSKERSKSSLNVGVKTNNHQSNDNGIPANAKIDYTGRKWVCNSGYRQDGNRCLKITVPANAKIDYTGRKWVCNSGYQQDGNRCLKITVPVNAKIDYTGRKWVCNSGYRQDGNHCLKITVPANAKIDYTGRKWVCNSGYRQDGNRCLKITVPVNAKIDYTGRKWVCNSGYRQDGNRCLKITVPVNAKIDYTGRKWVCNSGYRQDGNRCLKITVPANAQIDYTGRKWVCNSGYRQDGNRCLKITVPANAQIDYTGRKWVCNSGYRQEGDQCVDY